MASAAGAGAGAGHAASSSRPICKFRMGGSSFTMGKTHLDGTKMVIYQPPPPPPPPSEADIKAEAQYRAMLHKHAEKAGVELQLTTGDTRDFGHIHATGNSVVELNKPFVTKPLMTSSGGVGSAYPAPTFESKVADVAEWIKGFPNPNKSDAFKRAADAATEAKIDGAMLFDQKKHEHVMQIFAALKLKAGPMSMLKHMIGGLVRQPAK